MSDFEYNCGGWMKKIWILLCILKVLWTFQSVGALSINPPSEEIFSNQLCPDPTTKSSKQSIQVDTSIGSNGYLQQDNGSGGGGENAHKWKMPDRVMSINLDKPKDSTHFYESCTFKEETMMGSSKGRSRRSVRVRSINLNINSWNFSAAEECGSFIKFNNWDLHDGGRYPVLCGRENFDQFLGPYGHPMVLYYQWKNGGLSFPLFHSSFGDHHRDRKDTLQLNYMQIYFFVLNGGKEKGQPPGRKCRVQQYKLDWMRLGCGAVVEDLEPVCGEYHCSDLEELYKAKMTIFKDGEENDTVLVWKPKQDKYRMRTFLRQKFVPVVFLIVLIFAYRSYMKAGLRYNSSMQEDVPDFRVRSFRLRRRIPSARAFPSDPYWEYDSDDPPPSYPHSHSHTATNSSGMRVPSNSSASDLPAATPQLPFHAHSHPPKIFSEGDPPPPYDAVMSPPTYSEATVNKPQ